MDIDYFSVEAILAENHKVQCTFKEDIPDMGHLGGGSDRNRPVNSQYLFGSLTRFCTRLYFDYALAKLLASYAPSQWADFNIPIPFSQRVRNALRAEACSVRLSNLVGAGGTWYGFGKVIMDLVDDERATELSQVLTSAFRSRLAEIVDQAHHFATSTAATSAGHSNDTAQLFREGLDATEREIFTLAHESAKRTKSWYEDRAPNSG